MWNDLLHTNQVVLMLYFSNILSRRRTPIVPAKRPDLTCQCTHDCQGFNPSIGRDISLPLEMSLLSHVLAYTVASWRGIFSVPGTVLATIASKPSSYSINVHRNTALDFTKRQLRYTSTFPARDIYSSWAFWGYGDFNRWLQKLEGYRFMVKEASYGTAQRYTFY